MTPSFLVIVLFREEKLHLKILFVFVFILLVFENFISLTLLDCMHVGFTVKHTGSTFLSGLKDESYRINKKHYNKHSSTILPTKNDAPPKILSTAWTMIGLPLSCILFMCVNVLCSLQIFPCYLFLALVAV